MNGVEQDGYTIHTIASLDCVYQPEPWPFAEEHRAAIDRHWDDLVRQRPHLFNGRVLIQTRGAIERRAGSTAIFRGAYTDVAFKAFIAWRDFGNPARGFRNGFGMAALRTADGAFVLGEMGAHTANPGQVYFPSGTPDLSDIVGQRVDIEGSIRRELAEETGLDSATLTFEDGLTMIANPLRVCFMKDVRADEPAASLVARVEAAIARETLPELSRMHVVRTVADITSAMPPFVALYLRHRLARGDQSG